MTGAVVSFEPTTQRRSIWRLAKMGYCASDIAAMIGVSRERVRQWMNKKNIRRPAFGSLFRVWDDDTNQFRSVTAKELGAQKAAEYRIGYKWKDAQRAACINHCDNIKDFYLGLTDVGGRKSFRDVKHYKRRKRWIT